MTVFFNPYGISIKGKKNCHTVKPDPNIFMTPIYLKRFELTRLAASEI